MAGGLSAAAARSGSGAALRPRHRRRPPQRAGAVHAGGAGADLRDARHAQPHRAETDVPAMLVLMLIMAADGILLARRVNKAVDAKFPDNGESHWKLGVYAAGRLHRCRMRAPRPQVERGRQGRLSRSGTCARWCSVGIRSGKSRWAEGMPSPATGPVCYLATGAAAGRTRTGRRASPGTATAACRLGDRREHRRG